MKANHYKMNNFDYLQNPKVRRFFLYFAFLLLTIVAIFEFFNIYKMMNPFLDNGKYREWSYYVVIMLPALLFSGVIQLFILLSHFLKMDIRVQIASYLFGAFCSFVSYSEKITFQENEIVFSLFALVMTFAIPALITILSNVTVRLFEMEMYEAKESEIKPLEPTKEESNVLVVVEDKEANVGQIKPQRTAYFETDKAVSYDILPKVSLPQTYTNSASSKIFFQVVKSKEQPKEQPKKKRKYVKKDKGLTQAKEKQLSNTQNIQSNIFQNG